jgi:hypothetical protein
LEIVESYPEDKYLPGFLVRGECEGLVFHAQIGVRDMKVRVMEFPFFVAYF